jgi:hypothetical protein
MADFSRGGWGGRDIVDDIDYERLRSGFAKTRLGQFTTCHLPAFPDIELTLAELQLSTLFLLRDPRDVLISDVHYILNDPTHPLHIQLSAFRGVGPSARALIVGIEPNSKGPGIPPFAERLAAYTRWLQVPAVCAVRFEDLVGPAGGESAERQRDAADRISRYVSRPLDGRQLDQVCSGVWSRQSSTFRQGQAGAWRQVLSDADISLLEDRAGAEIAAWGYG